MELVQLEQLAAFEEYGTLSKAAEELHISQPTLTRAMKNLEEEFHVSLFERRKNKLELNENGRLACQYAKKVLQESRDMVERVRSLDRANHTISVGSCAPAPLWELLPMLTDLYYTLTVGSEMRGKESLIDGLNDGTYQIIILSEKLDNPEWLCLHWGEEQLYFSLPKSHPLAGSDSLYLKDMDGENMLLFTDIGFWKHLVDREMPACRFLLQNERFCFDELVNSSVLPSFTSDLARNVHDIDEGSRVNIRVKDDDAHVTYYCYCLKSEQERLQLFVKEMKRRQG
ncbi:MAG: LysR family transcriptional regulator [Acetatifactor muris]|nr:LysR family transcriptional regulator [Acetatifactor muris]